ncbi:hypothetical protein GOBAR_DD08782 [Gossypium barbadense]|nr:hypothetical protein GOBAR_DD08782 [Gossypium barbadense]
MESETARRRISNIASHFSPCDDTLSVSHLLPMNCSGRCDNRMYFARQGSAFRACFMRQVSRPERTAPQCFAPPKSVSTPLESSNAIEAPLFSRPTMMDSNLSNLAKIEPLGLDWRLSMPDPPKFARPNKNTSDKMPLQSKKNTCWSISNDPLLGFAGSSLLSGPHLVWASLTISLGWSLISSFSFSGNTPAFGPMVILSFDVFNGELIIVEPLLPSQKPSLLVISLDVVPYEWSKLFVVSSNNELFGGTKWSPKMDVAESGHNYIMMVEVPGVSIGDIRVEVDDQNLTVRGKRSSHCWKLAADCSDGSISAYHKREISQGPYQVVWPLPANVNRDSVSAEFL